jgi:hypothetical protein
MFNQRAFRHKAEGYTVTAFDIDPAAPVKVKDANDAGWQKAIAYRRDEDDGAIFIRSERDFMNRFEQVEQPV